jgi:hypothetical protein
MSPFGTAAAAAFFLKRSCSRLVKKKKQFTVHWVPPVFCVGNAVFAKQELHVFCTVHVIALFNEQCN